MHDKTLFVGIGSSHGDDQIGWLVVDEVEKLLNGAACRRAATPAELLNWIDGIDELVLCDAVVSSRPAGCVDSWTWPSPQLVRVSFQGSHDLSLVATLEIAEELGRLPPQVRIWGVAISSATPMECISSEIIESVPGIAKRICQERCHA